MQQRLLVARLRRPRGGSCVLQLRLRLINGALQSLNARGQVELRLLQAHLSRFECSAGGVHLLLQVLIVELNEQLTDFHMVAFIDQHLTHQTGNLRRQVDVLIGLELAGDGQVRHERAARHGHDAHGANLRPRALVVGGGGSVPGARLEEQPRAQKRGDEGDGNPDRRFAFERRGRHRDAIAPV